MKRVICFATILLVSAMCAGCTKNDEPPRYRISGVVTFRGEPVPRGSIQFIPVEPIDGKKIAGTATIIDGKYDTDVDGKGFSGGPQVVTVEAFDGNYIDEDLPNGAPIEMGFLKKFDLPVSKDAVLDIELLEK